MNAITLAVCLIGGFQQPTQERDELRERSNAMMYELGGFSLDVFYCQRERSFSLRREVRRHCPAGRRGIHQILRRPRRGFILLACSEI